MFTDQEIITVFELKLGVFEVNLFDRNCKLLNNCAFIDVIA